MVVYLDYFLVSETQLICNPFCKEHNTSIPPDVRHCFANNTRTSAFHRHLSCFNIRSMVCDTQPDTPNRRNIQLREFRDMQQPTHIPDETCIQNPPVRQPCYIQTTYVDPPTKHPR